MRAECSGWPAPHMPPIVLRDGDGPVSHGLCPACDAVLALLDAPRSPRLTRFVARLEMDRDRAYVSGSQWSRRDIQLRHERLMPIIAEGRGFQIVHEPRCTNDPCTCADSGALTIAGIITTDEMEKLR